eukprot:TRINITY_DN1673_c0_g2_i1.p1 TRINITY_DN1673_c0_g2~~TRINITY_DN1673_c0_g2_i1.p1  ORF type:complete len:147 (+),score=21.70 TRINITY_DN1673_c0_g2_i1:40-480(+)
MTAVVYDPIDEHLLHEVQEKRARFGQLSQQLTLLRETVAIEAQQAQQRRLVFLQKEPLNLPINAPPQYTVQNIQRLAEGLQVATSQLGSVHVALQNDAARAARICTASAQQHVTAVEAVMAEVASNATSATLEATSRAKLAAALSM